MGREGRRIAAVAGRVPSLPGNHATSCYNNICILIGKPPECRIILTYDALPPAQVIRDVSLTACHVIRFQPPVKRSTR